MIAGVILGQVFIELLRRVHEHGWQWLQLGDLTQSCSLHALRDEDRVAEEAIARRLVPDHAGG